MVRSLFQDKEMSKTSCFKVFLKFDIVIVIQMIKHYLKEISHSSNFSPSDGVKSAQFYST